MVDKLVFIGEPRRSASCVWQHVHHCYPQPSKSMFPVHTININHGYRASGGCCMHPVPPVHHLPVIYPNLSKFHATGIPVTSQGQVPVISSSYRRSPATTGDAQHHVPRVPRSPRHNDTSTVGPTHEEPHAFQARAAHAAQTVQGDTPPRAAGP